MNRLMIADKLCIIELHAAAHKLSVFGFSNAEMDTLTYLPGQFESIGINYQVISNCYQETIQL